MKNNFTVVVLICLTLASTLLSGCGNGIGHDEPNRPDLKTIVDYHDWFYDIDNTERYNHVQWIELDVWLTKSIYDYDWSDVSYDVLYEGQVISSNLDVGIEFNYFKCSFDTTYEGAILGQNGYLAPGTYEIILKDSENSSLFSSKCTVTEESGEVLSEMVTSIQQIDCQDGQIALQINFDKNITPYTKKGFYITVSNDGGETNIIPNDYSIDIADTYITVYCHEPNSMKTIILSVYCGDGTYVCEWEK